MFLCFHFSFYFILFIHLITILTSVFSICASVYLMTLLLNHLNLNLRELERKGAHIFCVQPARFLVSKSVQSCCNYRDGQPGASLGMFHDKCFIIQSYMLGTSIVIWTMTRRQSEPHAAYLACRCRMMAATRHQALESRTKLISGHRYVNCGTPSQVFLLCYHHVQRDRSTIFRHRALPTERPQHHGPPPYPFI